MPKASWYTRFAKKAARFCGRPQIFALAVFTIAVWVITGPIFSRSRAGGVEAGQDIGTPDP